MELHKIFFKGVEEIVNRHDPIGLVEGGAPDDEYHTEVGQIVSLLRSELNRESLADEIQVIFKNSFGGQIKNEKELFLTLSEELLGLKKRLRW